MKIEQYRLVIEYEDIAALMTPEQVVEFRRDQAFRLEAVQAAINTLATGYTDGEGDYAFSLQDVAALREKLIPLMDQATAEMVRYLMSDRDYERSRRERSEKWADHLYNDIRECAARSHYEKHKGTPREQDVAPWESVPLVERKEAMAEARRRFESYKATRVEEAAPC